MSGHSSSGRMGRPELGSLYTVDPTTREVTPFYSPSGEEEEEEDQLIDFDVATGGHLIAMISALGGLKV